MREGPIGFVDHVSFDSANGLVVGWAIDLASGAPPQAYVLCDDERPVAFLKPNWERRDIAKAYSLREPLIAGVWLDLARDAFPAALKAYALWDGGGASEMPIYRPHAKAASQPAAASPRESTAPGTA